MATTTITGTAGDDLIVSHPDIDYLKGKLVFVLGATPAQGGWPHPNILINGQVVAANVEVSSYVLAGNTQVVSVALPAGPITSIGIQYWDDLVTSVDDRNIYIGSVTLNGTPIAIDGGTYVRNDYSTISTQHDLDWNGTMTWSGAQISAAMASGTTVDSHVVDGAAGSDIVSYAGRETNFNVGITSDGAITVTPKEGGFFDTLWNVENAFFDDHNAYGGGFDAAIDMNAHTIDGGRGLDTLVLKGNHTDYFIQHTTTGFSITGPGVSEWVTNVERLQFQDGWVGLDISGDAGKAYRLYQAAFNRSPDLPGLAYQTFALDTNATIQQVAANFIASPEFQAKYGAVDNSQFITLLYENVLHRTPQQFEVDYHLGEFAHGDTRAQMLINFSESPENQANVIGQIQDGMFMVQW